MKKKSVLVVLRQGSATPHGDQAPVQAKEIVAGVDRWTINPSECLELYGAEAQLVATFRDWSFVKFIESRD